METVMSESLDVHKAIDWLQDRLKERTSWDGLTIIVISVVGLIATPLIKYAAWAGLAYGLWTFFHEDRGPRIP